MDLRFLLLLSGLSSTLAASVFSRCVPSLVDNIKRSWMYFGIPTIDELSTYKGYLTAYRSSMSALINPVKCKQYLVDNGKFTLLVDGVPKELILTMIDGVIYVQDTKFYLLFWGDGVYSGYKCSDDGPEPTPDNPPLGGIYVTDLVDPEALAQGAARMALAGFDLTKTYHC